MIIGLLLTVQILVAFALIAIVLIQQTDNSGLGLAGSSGGGDASSLLQTRASATFLTRATSGLAAAFILVSLAQGIISGGYGAGFLSNRLGITEVPVEVDNARGFSPIVFDDEAPAADGETGISTPSAFALPGADSGAETSAPAAGDGN